MCHHYRNDVRKAGVARDLYGFEEISESRIPIRFRGVKVDVFPDTLGLVVRRVGDRAEMDTMRWGFPPPPDIGARPVTNVRNLSSPYWRAWLEPEWRCLVPFTEFSEWTVERPKREVWFTPEGVTAAAFAGIWRPWTDIRTARSAPDEGECRVFAILTCEPNGVVAPIHPKAMPVVLYGREAQEAWLDAPVSAVPAMQKPLADDRLTLLAA